MIDPPLRITIEIGTIIMTIKTGIDLAGPGPIHTVIDTGVTVTMTHKEVTLGPITNPHTTAITSQKLKHILLLTRHPTQQILITQKFFQRSQ